MWGWKPVSRRLPGVGLGDAVAALVEEGFATEKQGQDFALLKKPGRKWMVFTGRAAPLDAKLFVEPEEDAVELKLAYDMSMGFDTGDLRREADRLQQTIASRT